MEVGTRMMMRIFLFPVKKRREISRIFSVETLPLNSVRIRTCEKSSALHVMGLGIIKVNI
jgi:hypothetical protein